MMAIKWQITLQGFETPARVCASQRHLKLIKGVTNAPRRLRQCTWTAVLRFCLRSNAARGSSAGRAAARHGGRAAAAAPPSAACR